ncbi:MAG: hypothetical protein ACP5KA_03760 [Desulfurococcaceae archaeon]
MGPATAWAAGRLWPPPRHQRGTSSAASLMGAVDAGSRAGKAGALSEAQTREVEEARGWAVQVT